ncbi:MAG TPA: GlsB/YeaQ/YmgE family stress response membrane protein [Anaerolineales bacterium]|nr:GlsB/YeaQ/YmgE family stress response membrane protein [Anaerolineales bacterium]
MNILIYLIVAAVIGWLASEIMKDRASLLINIVVGIVGAFVAGYLVSPLVGVPPISVGGAFNVSTLLVSLVGAVIVIWVVHLLRRRV